MSNVCIRGGFSLSRLTSAPSHTPGSAPASPADHSRTWRTSRPLLDADDDANCGTGAAERRRTSLLRPNAVRQRLDTTHRQIPRRGSAPASTSAPLCQRHLRGRLGENHLCHTRNASGRRIHAWTSDAQSSTVRPDQSRYPPSRCSHHARSTTRANSCSPNPPSSPGRATAKAPSRHSAGCGAVASRSRHCTALRAPLRRGAKVVAAVGAKPLSAAASPFSPSPQPADRSNRGQRDGPRVGDFEHPRVGCEAVEARAGDRIMRLPHAGDRRHALSRGSVGVVAAGRHPPGKHAFVAPTESEAASAAVDGVRASVAVVPQPDVANETAPPHSAAPAPKKRAQRSVKLLKENRTKRFIEGFDVGYRVAVSPTAVTRRSNPTPRRARSAKRRPGSFPKSALRARDQKSNRPRNQIQNNLHAFSPAKPALMKIRCAKMLTKAHHPTSLTEEKDDVPRRHRDTPEE